MIKFLENHEYTKIILDGGLNVDDNRHFGLGIIGQVHYNVLESVYNKNGQENLFPTKMTSMGLFLYIHIQLEEKLWHIFN